MKKPKDNTKFMQKLLIIGIVVSIAFNCFNLWVTWQITRVESDNNMAEASSHLRTNIELTMLKNCIKLQIADCTQDNVKAVYDKINPTAE